jgi:hypothetical protein
MLPLIHSIPYSFASTFGVAVSEALNDATGPQVSVNRAGSTGQALHGPGYAYPGYYSGIWSGQLPAVQSF